MIINTIYGAHNASKARGLTVVIDVFRAFSTACYIFGNGAKSMIPVETIEEAFQLRKEHPEYILVGERNGAIIPGFDYGNSPFELLTCDFLGKTIIHTTTMGTRGLVNAKKATELLTGSFVNAGSIIRHIKQKNPKEISLVCTGTPDSKILNEDALFAIYISNELRNKPNNFQHMKESLRAPEFSSWFFDPAITSHPLEDFDLCLSLNRFNFILVAESNTDGFLYLKKVSTI